MHTAGKCQSDVLQTQWLDIQVIRAPVGLAVAVAPKLLAVPAPLKRHAVRRRMAPAVGLAVGRNNCLALEARTPMNLVAMAKVGLPAAWEKKMMIAFGNQTADLVEQTKVDAEAKIGTNLRTHDQLEHRKAHLEDGMQLALPSAFLQLSPLDEKLFRLQQAWLRLPRARENLPGPEADQCRSRDTT